MADDERTQKHSLLFMELVTSFQMGALHGLGKMVNPMTGKTEVDLNTAAMSIDMLDMLAVRTRGNTPPEEARSLDEVISHLKLNFVEEVNKAGQKKPEDAAETAATESAAADAEQNPPPDADKES
ncbi:MAG: DUF1844 domain-containing protein [bacterium]|nr:DUF1844 domain-containing protein [bacterium]